MRSLVRVTSIAVLAVVVLLLAGQGPWLVDLQARVLGAAPAGGAPAAGSTGAVIGMLAGLGASVVPPVARAVAQVVTLLHELGHIVVAAALGARPAGIVLRHDASGHATARWRGDPGPLRRLALAVVALIGLPAPAVAAAAGVELLVVAGPEPVLWSAAIAGTVVALLARSLWSLVVALVLVGLAILALGEAAQPGIAAAAVGLLVAVALSSVLDALPRLTGRIRAGDDARVVATLLRVPARLVRWAQVLAVLAAGGWALWRLLAPTLGELAALGG